MNRDSGVTSFFRQSGWMVFATGVGSFCMVLVHSVARKMDANEYSDFFVLLKLMALMAIPGMALQTAFARQSACALTDEGRRELFATTRAVLGLILFGLVVFAITSGIILKPASDNLGISNPISLGVAVVLGIIGLIGPMVRGVLQGWQQFGSLGLLQILDGPIRLVGLIVIVLLLQRQSVGAMLAVGLGQVSVIAVGIWMIRGIWRPMAHGRFRGMSWLRSIVPLTVGIGTVTLMNSMDTIFVKQMSRDENANVLYQGAAMTSYAIVQILAPITQVMFARIVRSSARGERSGALFLTLKITVAIGVFAALVFTLAPALPLKVIYLKSPEMWQAAPLVPWFNWIFVPLMLANVLVQSLLADKRYKALPWLVLVAGLYVVALWAQKSTLAALPAFAAFKRVVQTLGVFNVIFLVTAAWHSRTKATSRMPTH